MSAIGPNAIADRLIPVVLLGHVMVVGTQPAKTLLIGYPGLAAELARLRRTSVVK